MNKLNYLRKQVTITYKSVDKPYFLYISLNFRNQGAFSQHHDQDLICLSKHLFEDLKEVHIHLEYQSVSE